MSEATIEELVARARRAERDGYIDAAIAAWQSVVDTTTGPLAAEGALFLGYAGFTYLPLNAVPDWTRVRALLERAIAEGAGETPAQAGLQLARFSTQDVRFHEHARDLHERVTPYLLDGHSTPLVEAWVRAEAAELERTVGAGLDRILPALTLALRSTSATLVASAVRELREFIEDRYWARDDHRALAAVNALLTGTTLPRDVRSHFASRRRELSGHRDDLLRAARLLARHGLDGEAQALITHATELPGDSQARPARAAAAADADSRARDLMRAARILASHARRGHLEHETVKLCHRLAATSGVSESALRARHEMALSTFNAGDDASAIEWWRPVIEQGPDDIRPQATFLTACSESRCGDVASALMHFEWLATGSSTWRSLAALRSAQLATDCGDFELAEERLRQLTLAPSLRQRGEVETALLRLGSEAAAHGSVDSARRVYSLAVAWVADASRRQAAREGLEGLGTDQDLGVG